MGSSRNASCGTRWEAATQRAAAAFVASARRPPALSAVTLDERLAEAMRKEGFPVVEIA